MQRVTARLEVLAWAALAFCLATSMRTMRPMPLYDDSYQYLDMAANLSRGHGSVTSLVHFDAERSHGHIPAPATHFPPGFPAVIAIVGSGTDLEVAARVVSGACFATTAALLVWGLVLTGVTRLFRQLLLLLFVTNAVALHFSGSVLSEPLYMALSTGAVVGLLWAEGRDGSRRATVAVAIAACVLAGLACWVRYAGYFLIAAVVGYQLLRVVLERRTGNRRGRLPSWIMLIPLTFGAALMVRNKGRAGTWTGGHDMPVHHALTPMVWEFVRAQLHLVLGKHAATFGVWEGLLLLGLLVTAVAAALALRSDSVPAAKRTGADLGCHRDTSVLLAVFCVVIYCACMFLAGLRTFTSYDARMYLPIFPLYLLLAGFGASWMWSRMAGARRLWLSAGLVVFVLGYAGVNARDLFVPLPLSRQQVLKALYDQPDGEGEPLDRWLDAHIPSSGTILAADGQATGYFLRRPTVSMVTSEYSPVRWECDEIEKVLRRFGAKWLILYKQSSGAVDSILEESRFAATSATEAPLCGFTVAAENEGVRVLMPGLAAP